MSDEARQRAMTHALNAIAKERAGVEHYQENQRLVRTGKAGRTSGARPLEFDERLPHQTTPPPGFVARVARLLRT